MSTDGARRKALFTLPPTLFETYERILARVNETCEENQLLVERALKWTICAEEPLSAKALLDVLAINQERTRLDRDYITNEEKILELCSSLIRRTPGSSGFELAHFTVKEFLLALDPAKKDSLARYHVEYDKDEIQLASDCLRYICFEDFEAVRCDNEESMDQHSERFPFYGYAALHWDDHAHNYLEHSGLTNQVKSFFTPLKIDQFICWSQYYYYKNFKGEYEEDTSNTTTLHWASCLALPEICEWLIEEGCETDKGSGLGTPLRCAIMNTDRFVSERWYKKPELCKWRCEARIETIQILLSAGASVHTRPHPKSNDSLLFLAIQLESGLENPLLKAGAEIDDDVLEWMTDNEEFDALKLVSERNLCEEIRPKYLELILNLKKNDVKVVTTLLENTRKQLFAAKTFKTILQEAAVWGNIKVLQGLAQRSDLDLNTTFGSDGSTALHLSSLNGHFEAVKILVEKESNLHQRNNDGDTPVHQATLGSNLKVLKYLQNNGADLHEINNYGLLPLHVAAQSRNLEVVQYLLQMSQEHLLSKTRDGRIPLMCAAEKGSLDVARLIIENSNESHLLAKSKDGRTCLHFAAMSSEYGMPNLFIDKGIPLDAQSDDGSTALQSSLNGKNPCDNFVLLLEIGASLTIPMNDGTLPIHQICKSGGFYGVDRLKALIQFSGKAATYLNCKTRSGITPLQILVSENSLDNHRVEMIETLTNQIEIDVECLNERHETPLIQLARKLGDGIFMDYYTDNTLAAMGCLLGRGANSNATCQDSRTALHYMFPDDLTLATFRGAHLLIDHNAKVDIQDNCKQTVVDLIFEMWETKVIDRQIHGVTKITKTVLEMMSIDQLQEPLNNGSLPLEIAAIWVPNKTLVNLLLDYNVGVDPVMESVCIYGCESVTAGRLISRSTNLLEFDKSGLGLIHIASKNGQDGIIEELLLAKVGINTLTS